MLTKEAANAILRQWRVSPDLPEDELSQGNTRFFAQYERLPAPLKKIAFALASLDEQGEPNKKKDGDSAEQARRANLKALLKLPAAKQLQLLKIPLPRMAEQVVRALDWMKGMPYQVSYGRKAYRAPQHPLYAFSRQENVVNSLLQAAEIYREEVLTPEWLAIWAPYAHPSWHSLESVAVPLLASVIDQGGKEADEVLELLLQCGRNEHEHGTMGRHVLGALLSANRVEGWEFVEKLLLAAQRQEGLRQVILETIDLSHPEAFARLLKLIEDENLVRFSAVTRALNVWLGYAWDSESTRVVNQSISKLRTFLEDPAAQQTAVTGDDPESAYLALWSIALRDVDQSIAPATKLLHSKRVELRYVATVHLCNLRLPQLTTQPLLRAIDDEDLRIASLAANSIDSGPQDEDEDEVEVQKPTKKPAALIEPLERLVNRLPAKPEVQAALVWPWTETKLDRSHIAARLASALEGHPPARVVPYLPMLDVWHRARLIAEMAKAAKWPPELREMMIRLAGDTASQVREAAIKALHNIELTQDECIALEGLLTRKAADLRIALLGLLKKRSDEQALASADRLLASKQSPQRLAGLELVRELKEQARDVAACQTRAESYRRAHKKLAKDEQTHLAAIEAQASPSAGYTLENGLGLLDPSKRSTGQPPRARKCVFWTPAAKACLQSLDDLIHEHREEPVTIYKQVVLLGTVTYGFPHAHRGKKALKELPLREIWEGWLKARKKSLRDKDGLELYRAQLVNEFHSDYSFEEKTTWAKRSPARQPLHDLLQFDFPKLRYPQLVERLLDWLLLLEPPAQANAFLIDCFETLCAAIPEKDHEQLNPAFAKLKAPSSRFYSYRESEFQDWRNDSPVAFWHSRIEISLRWSDLGKDLIERLWKLMCWFDQPVPNAMRYRPSESLLLAAYLQKIATLDDFTDSLVGPREIHGYSRNFSLLSRFTHRRTDRLATDFLNSSPALQQLLTDVRARILDIELVRGDTATVATAPAHDLQSLTGIDTLRRILHALGKNSFKAGSPYGTKSHAAESFTHLAEITNPAETDTPEYFRKVMKAAVAAKEFPEERLIQLAFLAPQWVPYLEAYFEWPGMAEGVYWFLAHMSFLWGSDAGERAAEGAGIVEEQEEDSSDTDANESAEDDDSTENATEAAEPEQPKLSPWQKLILERTPLTEAERSCGAIDVAWFHRVHTGLGKKRWEQLAQAARYASTPAQARKARLIAEVLLGEANLKDLIAGIEQRQLKDNVRLIGLFPLPNGAKREAELKLRFQVLQAYQQYARGLSGLTKPQAMLALDIGLKNLAATAGYADPLRLEWALGAEELQDLAKGPVAITKDGVTVTLQLDSEAQPTVSVARGTQPLKAAPAAVKKTPAVADLYARAKDIKRKSSRMRGALEQCMCRGDTFSSKELASLMGHPLVAPLLRRLVLVGEGILGYPVQNGKALQDCDGKLEPVKKDETLRIAHPHDLFVAKNWSTWQRDCFQAERIQPFKQVFRELYVLTSQERSDREASRRYAGQQVSPRQAAALWATRGWNSGDAVFKTFHDIELTATVEFNHGITTPLEVEGLTIDSIEFSQRVNGLLKTLPLAKVPPRIFSEVMRDCDLVVSVAHRGGVDPEASASTVEMRASLIRETAQLMGLKNVKTKANQAVITGHFSNYTVHLGSGTVHRMPGGSLCIVPVHAQHRGRLFLPFADDDPRSAEVLSKVLLLSRDQEIQDPSILEQLRN